MEEKVRRGGEKRRREEEERKKKETTERATATVLNAFLRMKTRDLFELCSVWCPRLRTRTESISLDSGQMF